jgi:hypothetical protein
VTNKSHIFRNSNNIGEATAELVIHPKERIARTISRMSWSIGYLPKRGPQTAGGAGKRPWFIFGILSIEIHNAEEIYHNVEAMK